MKFLLFLYVFFVVHTVMTSKNELLNCIKTPSEDMIISISNTVLTKIIRERNEKKEIINFSWIDSLKRFIEKKASVLADVEIRPLTLLLKIKALSDKFSTKRRVRKNCTLLLTISLFYHYPHSLRILSEHCGKIAIDLTPAYELRLEKKLKEIDVYYEKTKKEE